MAQAQAGENLSPELSRVFQAKRENVFRAWTDPQVLKHFDESVKGST